MLKAYFKHGKIMFVCLFKILILYTVLDFNIEFYLSTGICNIII